jgi:hypothetical protein
VKPLTRTWMLLPLLVVTVAPPAFPDYLDGKLQGTVKFCDGKEQKGPDSLHRILVTLTPLDGGDTISAKAKETSGSFQFLGLRLESYSISFVAGGQVPDPDYFPTDKYVPADNNPTVQRTPVCLVLRNAGVIGLTGNARKEGIVFLFHPPPSSGPFAEPQQEPSGHPRPPGATPSTLAGVVGMANEPRGTKGLRVVLSGVKGDAVDLIAAKDSGDDGAFTLTLSDHLNYPEYLLTVSGAGFDTATRILQDLPTGRLPRIDVRRRDSKNASVLLIDLADPIQGQRFDKQSLEVLPLSGYRQFDQLALLLPGVVPPPETIGPAGPRVSPGLGSTGQFSANGLRPRENNFTLDGTDNNDEEVGARRQGFVIPGPQPLESLAEFQVLTGMYDAQYGKEISAQVNAYSSFGGRQLHGTAYGFLTDRRLDPRSYFDLRPGSLPAANTLFANGQPVMLDNGGGLQPLTYASPITRNLPNTRVMSGAALSGPLYRLPATFFSSSFEFDRTRRETQGNFAVPTIAQRGFDGKGAAGMLDKNNSPLYPSTMTGDAIFSLYPFPNNYLGPYGANTYSTILPADQDGWQGSQRLDRQYRFLRVQNSLGARYNFSKEISNIPATGGAIDSSIQAKVQTQGLGVFLVSNPSPKVTNSVRFSYGGVRFNFASIPSPAYRPSRAFPSDGSLLNSSLMINETLPDGGPARFRRIGDTEAITGPVGQVNLAGFSGVGTDATRFPQSRNDGTFQFSDIASWQRGKHLLTAGVETWLLTLYTDVVQDANPRMDFFGERGGDMLSSTDVVAAGIGGTRTQTFSVSPSPSFQIKRHQTDFFLKDEFHPSSRFSLTLGIRFNFNGLPRSAGGKLEDAYNPKSGIVAAEFADALASCEQSVKFLTNGASFCQETNSHLLKVYPLTFDKVFDADPYGYDPRAGFAWDTRGDGKTVFRGGFGIYTGQFPAIILSESSNMFPQYLPLRFQLTGGMNFFSDSSAIPLSPGSINILQQNPVPNVVSLLYNTSNLTELVPTQPGANLQNPHSAENSLKLERRIDGGIILSAAYVGVFGRRLLRVDTPNAQSMGYRILDSIQRSNSSLPFPQATVSGYTTAPSVPLYAYAPVVNQTIYASGATSHYNSLQLEARVQRSRFRLSSAFTWSHSIDDASDFFDTAGSYALPEESTNPPGERASSNFDVRLRSVSNFVVDTPARVSGSRALDALLRRWTLSGILTLQTGQPFTVNTAYDTNQDGNLTDRLNTTSFLLGPGVGKNVAGIDARTRLILADPTVDTRQYIETSLEPTYGLIGCPSVSGRNPCDATVARNTFRAAGIENLDLALGRSLTPSFLPEGHRILVRLEGFNVLNRNNFAIPVRILEEPSFGKSVSTSTPNRVLQAVIKYSF